MMPDTHFFDIYMDVYDEARLRNIERLMRTVDRCSEKHDLSGKDYSALAAHLTYAEEHDEGRLLYATIVEYLWITNRIGYNTQCSLLDLLSEEQNR